MSNILLSSLFQEMQKSTSIIQRPSSNTVYRSNIVNMHPAEYQQGFTTINSRFIPNQRMTSIPLNQSSAINYGSNLIQNNSSFVGVKKNNSNLPTPLQTNRISFNYFSPETRKIERRYIETVIHQPHKQQINQWEQRYIELQKQMSSFLLIHQKMTQQFIKIKQEMKIFNQTSIQNSIDHMAKTQSLINQNYQEEIQNLNRKLQKSNQRFEQVQRQSKLFKDQNVRMQNMIQRSQSQLLIEKQSTHRLQSQNNQLQMQIKQLQFDIKQLKNQNSSLQTLKDENYQLKMKLAQKNIELQQLQGQKNKKDEQRTKTIQKLVQQKVQQRLARLRGQYEKKQKKIQKLRLKDISQMKIHIQDLEIRQRGAKQLKQKYQKMYNQKKQEVDQLRSFQQSTNMMGQNQKQIYIYEQRIQELNRIAAQKQQRIAKLEDDKKKLQKKIQQYHDNYVSQQQLANLHRIIEQKNDKLLSEGGVNYDPFNNKVETYFNGQIFQQKLIYQLKKDNQKLLQLLSKLSLNQKLSQPRSGVKKNKMVNSHQPASDDLTMDMKNMVSDIYYKVQTIVQVLKQTMNISSETLIRNHDLVSPKKSKRQKSPSKHKKTHQVYQSNPLATKISQDLQILKVYIMDLNSTCDSLSVRLQQEQQTRYMTSRKQRQVLQSERKITQMTPKDMEIIQFYKSKNQQLQSRIDQLLILNDKFKEKLCQKSQDKIRPNQSYWKNQARKLELQLQQTKTRYNKLLSQFEQSQDKKQNYQSKCALYSIQISRLHQLTSQNEQKLIQMNYLIKQIQQIRLAKTRIQRQISIWQHKYQDLEARLFDSQKSVSIHVKQIGQQRFKLEQQMKIRQSLESQLVQLTKKFEAQNKNNNTLKTSFQELTNKLQVHQKNNKGYDQRFSQSKNQVQNQRKINLTLQVQLNDLRTKIKQLQQLNSSLQISISQFKSIQKSRNDGLVQIDQLKKTNSILQSQIISLKVKIQQLTKKYSNVQAQSLQNWRRLERLGILQSENMQLKTRIQRLIGLEQQNNQQRNRIQRLNIFQSQNISLKNRLQRVEILQKENSELRIKLQNQVNSHNILKYQLKQKQKASVDNGSVDPYTLQKIRSRILLSETLTRQLKIQNSSRNRQISANLDKNYEQLLMLISIIANTSSSKGQDSIQIQQYIVKIQQLEQRIGRCRNTNAYNLEMLRSLLIQAQCLAFQIKVSDNRDRQVVKYLTEHIKKGFQTIAIFDLFEHQ